MRVDFNPFATISAYFSSTASARHPVDEVGSSSLTSVKKDEKGMVSRLFCGILSVPSMILKGAWAFFKYVIYFSTCGICCKPGYDPKVLIEGIEKVLKADDRKAEWANFIKNFPGAVDLLKKYAIEKIREEELGAKGNMNPKRVADWNKENLETHLESLDKRFANQDETLLANAADFLQQRDDAKATK